ncbi:hypothetical protein ACWDWO_06555 [Actinopolymorpha singaporensis]|uniref:Uncharacterized protein n=1 Tax=Actinopolymorpha singaporensis TaxID=117157 RepID=A0A1H1R1M4_9ACTN|nr:hypothetical protein [Actinopolymorpha singaporensis]SDS29694.1 hypothetical protein SAMN04489717_2241 [Actinopolymorpha singaporensis]
MKQSPRFLAAFGASIVLTIGTATAAFAGTGVDAAAPSSSAAAPSSAAVATAGRTALARSDQAADRFGIDRSPARAAVDRAINRDDYQCGPTDFDAYIDGLINGLSKDEFTFLVGHIEMLDVPTYDALLYGSDTDQRYALRSDYRTQLTHTFRDVKRFWDIQSGDIQLMSMHGSIMGDAAAVSRVLQLPLGEPFSKSPAEADKHAKEIAEAVDSGMFDGGNNPLFTLNAFAFTAEGDPDPLVKGVPDKLIFGDGIVDALNAMGIGDVGPRAVMGHEFGHHVQFEDNLFDSPLTGPEATRRTELMADAFGTYFATHARGLSLNTKRVLQAEKTFYEVGDCAFTNDGHHGTPNQRLRSSAWAAGIADAARPQGKILPSLTFADMFEQELPVIVAPDAS